MQNLKMGVRWAKSKYRRSDQTGEITHMPMCALTLVAITARIFYLIVIDAPETENSGWLAVLMGAGLSAPAILGAYALMKKTNASFETGAIKAIGKSGFRIFALILSLALTFETASLFTILTSSGAYATLYNMHKLLLLVPTSLAVIYACSKGGNGIGGAAEAWIRIYLILYAVILCLEYDTMKISNLFPILGPGGGKLFKSAVSVMMYFCLIPVSFLLETGYSVQGRNERINIKPESILIVFALSVAISVVMLMLHSAMYPALIPVFDSRSSGMDLMLSNGRSNRTVQLPILIIWFSSLAISAGYMLYSAGRLMNIALSEKGCKCMVLLGLIAMVFALFRLSLADRALWFASHFGPVIGGAFFLLPVIYKIKGNGRKKA
ncbi:MAG: hypothetical protein IJN21_04240 [Clostridia bacterium]|nr:hypothetical protein [Clostridia bacterium]